MANSLRRYQGVRNAPDIGGITSQDQNFETVVVIQMNVSCRNDLFEVFVLHSSQSIVELPDMMIVNEGYSSDHLCSRVANRLRDQGFAHQIPKRFGAICISLLRDHPIELIEQRRRNSDSDSAQFGLRGRRWFRSNR